MEETVSRYNDVCCTKTIQSDPKGFFNEFFEEVQVACGEKWLKTVFKNIKTDYERIITVFNDPKISDPIVGILENVKAVYKEKDAVFASQRRLQGEKYLMENELDKSLLFLNQAVIRSPANGINKDIEGGMSLALALWSRSAVLLELGNGKAALQDLKLCIHSMKTNQNPEYYWRTAKAYALVGENERAKISLAIMEKLLYHNKDKIEKCRQQLASLMDNLNKKLCKVHEKKSQVANKMGIKKSESIELTESTEKGKYMIARKDIKPGELILKEDPIAACLLPKYFGSHCHHCFERLTVPFGCSICSGVAFCSLECKEEACSTYHKFECQFMDLFIGSGMSILCFIALRVFTQSKNIEIALEVSDELIRKLCSHGNLRKPHDYLKRTLMAAFLLRCLQKANYFGRQKTEGINLTGSEIKVAASILGLLNLLQFNAHEIYCIATTPEHKFENSKTVYIGAGLYREGSYFNHDCSPMLARYFIGKSLVLTSLCSIKAKNSVTENYGPNFTKLSLTERQRTLQARYLFQCKCDACRENWPTLEKLGNGIKFRCITVNCGNIMKAASNSNLNIRCPACKKCVDLSKSFEIVEKCRKLYKIGAQYMQEQEIEKAIISFREGLELFYEVATLPHKETLIAQESLRVCFADYGLKYVM